MKKPLVTEKVSALNEHGKYGFEVHLKANKVEIKKAVEKAYGVNVESVRTLIIPGKKKSRNTKCRIIFNRLDSSRNVKLVSFEIN